MDLHNIVKSSGLKRKKIRVGRGDGTGKGNYSTRGLKGQKARSGYSKKAYFEGGQTPLFMRLPKLKGFKRYFKLGQDVQPINLGSLEADDTITNGTTVSKELLVEQNYINKITDVVKVLGTGDLTKKLSFEGVEHFSASAREKITAAGGSIAE